ncbi:FAD-dependent monooxygenase [Gammaproteobacteria bacterium]|jgi:salicylate hydroxylase|nr:FAD-dependent monooxygenase [Gammaproteobacteria bacterium]
MSDYRNHIGIIGGGIAGLTLGCALLKQGIPAIIFEKMSEETSHGAAISLSFNALCLLDRLDIYADLKNQSFIHSEASIQGPQKEISSFQTPEVLTTRRQTLMSLLYSRYIKLGGEICHHHDLESFDVVKSEVTFTNQNKYALKHLAACDGIRSSIRDAFFAANQDPKYSGYSAWRGIGKSNLQKIHFALGPDSHIVSYPINKDGDVSFVAVKKEDYQFKESWKEEGSISDLLDDFSAYDSKIFPALEDSAQIYKWGIYIRPPLKSMITKNITLLGDAAHPMVPFLGQGACMAIEDSYSFAMACKEHMTNLANAQTDYDYVRSKRTKKIQQLSMMQGKVYHLKNPILVAARNAIIKHTNIPGNDLKRIHDYDAHDEMQIHLT